MNLGIYRFALFGNTNWKLIETLEQKAETQNAQESLYIENYNSNDE